MKELKESDDKKKNDIPILNKKYQHPETEEKSEEEMQHEEEE